MEAVLRIRAHNLKDLKLLGGGEQGLGTTEMTMVMNVILLTRHVVVGPINQWDQAYIS